VDTIDSGSEDIGHGRAWSEMAGDERKQRAIHACAVHDVATLWELTDAWLTLQRKAGAPSPRTRTGYYRGVQILLAAWRNEDLVRPRRGAGASWIKDLEDNGLKPSTINVYRAAARSLYAALRWTGATKADPFRASTTRKAAPPTGKRASFSKDEVRALLDYATGDDRVLVLLGVHAGLRVDEMLALRWEDIDLRRREMVLQSGRGKPRVIRLTADLAAILQEQSEAGQRSPHVLPYRTRESAWRRLAILCRRVNIEPRGLHSLRQQATARATMNRSTRMPSTVFADATDLEIWARRRDAQGQLPQLVRRLIRASVGDATRVHFRAGEGVQLGGWDGIVDFAGQDAFVPNGISAWEMGTNGDIKSKANDDYRTRTSNPLGLDPAQTAFVFVTPRRWRDKDAWVAEKSKEGIWREVRAYDADDLETWLERAPAVHMWLSPLVGKDPGACQALERWWAAWSGATAPALSADLVIGGRDEEAKSVIGQLGGPPVAFPIRADSREEALAFVAACLEKHSETDSGDLLGRSVVVLEAKEWSRLAVSEKPLVLIPLYPDADVAGAVQAGHTVVIPQGKDERASRGVPELPRLRRSAAHDALKAMALPDNRADELATLARRSLLALRRKLAISPQLRRPEWASLDEARAMVPALLAGSWDEGQEGDQTILATLAGRSYEQHARGMARLAHASDPPVRRIGTMWLLVDKEDAWTQVSGLITADDLRQFESVALSVLGAVDPAQELDADQQWMASVLGKVPAQSGLLREGIADTLALMATRSGQTPLSGDLTGQEWADRVVRTLLARANADETGHLWASLSDVLPLLAEAAPNAFLEAVEDGLSGQCPLLQLFSGVNHRNMLFSRTLHTGLLWALENLAWSPAHLGHAALLLARLTRLAPLDTRIGNRPEVSLREIFLLWLPHTAAPLDRRLLVLDAVRKREPDVAWRLLVHLLPRFHDIGHPTHAPRWRDWKPDTEVGAVNLDWLRAIPAIVERLLADVGSDGRRWHDLIEGLGGLPTDMRDLVIERLCGVDPATFDEPGRSEVRAALRAMISQHRQFSSADWAMPAEQVDRLAEAYRRFEPDDIAKRVAPLFANRPRLLDLQDTAPQDFLAAVDAARDRAVRDVYEQGGISALYDLVSSVEQPWYLGWAVGYTQILEQDEGNVLADLDAPDGPRRQFARGYVAGRFHAAGWAWADAILGSEAATWTGLQRGRFLGSLPSSAHTFDWVQQFDDETARTYWLGFQIFGLKEPEDFARAVRNLLAHGQPWAAVLLLNLHPNRDAVAPDLVVNILEAATQTAPADQMDMNIVVFDVAQLLDDLARSGGVDDDRIAKLEWAFLPLLGEHRPPRLLVRELARDPEFFANVVTLVFKARSEEPREATKEEAALAQLGYTLLHDWRQVPGRREDGTVDAEALASWVAKAREVLSVRDRLAIGDVMIGQALSSSTADENGIWPCTAVRELIDEIRSNDLEDGIVVGVRNSRGVTLRGLTDGGAQERGLVERYNAYADAVSDQWPRTAAMLRRIARSFESDAKREDVRAEFTEDTWQ